MNKSVRRLGALLWVIGGSGACRSPSPGVEPRSAREWLALAEERLTAQDAIKVEVRREYEECVPPEVQKLRMTARIYLRKPDLVRIEFDKERGEGSGAIRIEARSDGSRLALRPPHVNRHGTPGGFRRYVLAGLVRAGADPSWLIYPVDGFHGSGDLPDPFGVEEIVFGHVDDPSLIELRYTLVFSWGLRFKVELRLDRQTGLPAFRTMQVEDPVTQHGLLGCKEKYSWILHATDLTEADFAIPGDWPEHP